MKTPPAEGGSLWDSLSGTSEQQDRALHGARCEVALHDLVTHSTLESGVELGGGSFLIHTTDPLCAALALVELDGVSQRMVLCPPGVADEHLAAIAATSEVGAVISDGGEVTPGLEHLEHIRIDAQRRTPRRARSDARRTEWILLTSGTSGVPKLVVHTLESLSGAIARGGSLAGPRVWSTYYDIRRYGGLQILLRALIGGGALVMADARESIEEFLVRAARLGVTHVTGTPSHWRRALMFPAARAIDPQYARMSGEIADQAIIDRLRAFYPDATVAHAFASTEAGVAFEVDDGHAGFPDSLIGRNPSGVELKVEDDTLRVRSSRTALRYLGAGVAELRDAEGFVDTGDVLEARDGRYFFVGRRGGIINVGGLKVHPEEVEAVINRHPAVRMSLVKSRRNPITGAVVVAEVVPLVPHEGPGPETERLKAELLEACRTHLAPYKIPASIRVVAALDVLASGKLARAES
jgi:acyl-coenzyme A synthetase/AMP-(fatty) acid ligase